MSNIMVLKNFVERLDLNMLKFMSDRLENSQQGDLYDVLHIIEAEYKDVDKFLASAKNADDFYRMLDLIRETVNSELNSRNG